MRNHFHRFLTAAFVWLVLAGVPAIAGDWKLVWSDEFDKPGLPDPAKWGYEVGYVRNQEAQYYTRGRLENARVENGLLVIEARKEHVRIGDLNPDAKSKRDNFVDYTAASLITKGHASWSNGRIEVRAKLPAGRGVWPAIWTLGTNINQVGWRGCGEIDIMEMVGFDPGVIHATVHSLNADRGKSIKIPDASEAFHVYSVEWDDTKLVFSVDGKGYHTFMNDGRTNSWPYGKDQYLLLNLAIGGEWGGQRGIDDTIFPQRFYVDYVRVYQKN